MGAADVPVGSSIESEADIRRRREAGERPKASIDVTNTEAVEKAIATHVTTIGRAKVAGFGPTGRSAGSGIHSGAESFTHRKGVVNTMGGAKDISRKEAPALLPPRGDKMPGARIMDVGGLDAHAVEGKAKRAAAESKMKAAAATAAPNLGGGGAISGFSKTGGVAVIKKAAGAPPSGGAVASRAPPGSHTGGGSGVTYVSDSASARETMKAIGGSGRVGGGSGSLASEASSAGMSDAEKRAAFFKKQIKDGKEKTAAAVEMLKGPAVA